MNLMENLTDKIEAFISTIPQDLQAFVRMFIDLIHQQWPIAEQYWLDDEGRVQYRYPQTEIYDHTTGTRVLTGDFERAQSIITSLKSQFGEAESEQLASRLYCDADAQQAFSDNMGILGSVRWEGENYGITSYPVYDVIRARIRYTIYDVWFGETVPTSNFDTLMAILEKNRQSQERKWPKGMPYYSHSPDASFLAESNKSCLRFLNKMPGEQATTALKERFLTNDLFINPAGGYPYFVPELLRGLVEKDALSYQEFKAIALAQGMKRGGLPLLREISYSRWRHGFAIDAPLKVQNYLCRLSREFLQDFDNENFRLCQFGCFYGAVPLLKILEHIESNKIRSISKKEAETDWSIDAIKSKKGILRCILFRQLKKESPEGVEFQRMSDEEAIRSLKQFSERTLLVGFSLSFEWHSEICQALGWPKLEELIYYLHELTGFNTGQWRSGIRPSPDEESGVVDRDKIKGIYDGLGEERYKRVMRLLKSQNVGLNESIFLVEASLGRNREEVEKRFAKRRQIAVRALGALPGEDILERYIALRQFAREANRYKAQRKRHERAAAAVGLKNLVAVSEYNDATALEWAMEAKMRKQREAEIETRVTVGEYEAKLEFESGKAELKYCRGDRQLKNAPSVLKKDEAFVKLKEYHAELKDQYLRFRETLENMMVYASWLTQAELESLIQNPVSKGLLERILIVDESGAIGLLAADGNALIQSGGALLRERPKISEVYFCTCSGKTLPLPQKWSVAHSFDLHQTNTLSDWQKYLFAQRITQPFKQVFRELYIITPAERETATFSNRYAGSAVDSRKAGALLGNRGWICPGEDEYEARKEFPQAGLVACISLTGHYQYLTDTDVLTVGEVSFCKKDSWRGIPLEDVPPRLFSEVMRDGDLLVSVAGTGDDAFASPSTIETRKQILGNLIPLLGLSNVTIGEDNFLHIEGKLANYRLHLASANIHVEPGSYLCVVPDWKKTSSRQKLFLPFEDEDMKCAEVVSKMLLLASDDKIKDSSILNQIRQHSAI